MITDTEPKRGKVFALEGPKGAGKTTLIAAILAARPDLRSATLPSRSAGGYSLARADMTPSQVRDAVIEECGPDLGRVMLLADCMVTVENIRRSGASAVMSRSAISTQVYQRLSVLHLVGDCRPDLVLYLDVPVDILKGRLFCRDGITAECDSEIAHESRRYQQAIADAEHYNWRVVRLDGTLPIPVLVEQALAAMGGDRMTPTQTQLAAVLWRYGWGPRSGEDIAFYRDPTANGWRLGNGTVVTPWKGRAVPGDPMEALRDIYAANGLNFEEIKS